MSCEKTSALVCVVLFMLSCGGNRKPADATGGASRQFPYVEVPVSLVSAPERADYAAQHWWDEFDFSDTALVSAPEVTEQGFVDFLMVLEAASSPSHAASALGKMYACAEPYPAMWDYLVELGEKYLYDPNSPVRDDELYVAVLEAQLGSERLSEAEKIGPRGRLEMALKNRVGQPAADFGFTLADGRKASLYGIGADYTVLFFYNLGCQACKEVREELLRVLSDEGSVAAGLYREGRLKVVAVYPDADMTEWDKYAGDIPVRWINGYDGRQTINDRQLYDLKAIPSLYLLDREKRVLLKDCTDAVRIAACIARAETARRQAP